MGRLFLSYQLDQQLDLGVWQENELTLAHEKGSQTLVQEPNRFRMRS